MPKIPIGIALKKVDLSLKKLCLGPKKILRMKNLSFGFKKQHRPSYNFKRLKLIRLKKKKIIAIATANKTDGPKKALLRLLKSMFWSPGS